MKNIGWLLLLIPFVCKAQDTMVSKRVVFNTESYKDLIKYGKCGEQLAAFIGKVYTVVGECGEDCDSSLSKKDRKFFAKQKDHYLLVSTQNDSGYILKSTLALSLAKGTVFTEDRFKEIKKKYSDVDIFTKMFSGHPWIGMDEMQLTITMGVPFENNRTIVKDAQDEQWIYYHHGVPSYYYFENGALTAIQDTK